MHQRWKGVPYEIVKDPVHGYVKLYEHELNILNTPAMQRLRRIKQLSTAYFVYPGATHDRLSHSIGTMHVAGLFTEKLLEPLVSRRELPQGEAQKYVFLMRLWGLTHDIGHGPFAHTFESAILSGFSRSHEHMSAKILAEDARIQSCMKKIEKNLGISTEQMVELLMKPREEWVSRKRIGRSEHFEDAFFWVLKGFYSADSIEYLLRDTLHTGAGFGAFDWQRLLLTSHLHQDKVVLEKRGREALDAFLLSRILMFDTVYYHRTSRAFDHILTNFLKKVEQRLNFAQCIDEVDKYMKLDDASILHNAKTKGIKERKWLLNRVNPYSMLTEEPLPISSQQPMIFVKLISRTDWNEELKGKITGHYPENAFFVDTPNLPSNPMKGEDKVFLLDTISGKVEPRPIWKTFWGEIPRIMYILRLYVNKRYVHLAPQLKNSFAKLLETETQGFPSYA